MDTLSGFLTGPRAQGAFLLRSELDPPWSLRIQDEAPLTVAAVVRGSAWVLLDDGTQRELHAGDVAVFRGPDHYTVSDSPATAPQVIIHPGQVCTTPDGTNVQQAMSLGVRTWGNSTDGETTLLTGTYQGAGELSRRLTETLPSLITLRAGEWECPVIPLLAAEITKDQFGQEAVLDRLLDLLVIAILRAWFDRHESSIPSWHRGQSDPVVGHALRAMHDNPAHPWTVVELARAAGVSRAALARRFHDLVGEPPMTFLTGWRLALAADLLLAPDATVSAVSRQVGYASPFTFSAAFKRSCGLSPLRYRQQRLAESAAAEATGT
ncbi:MAG: AraC-type DNA-binding protein-like protein [Frankiales bacterium]|nr:AraC-type DNA-binding protein-like protein [Frankiales bacterium]